MRRGRPRKIGPRHRNGHLSRPLVSSLHPGKAAVYVIELIDGIVKIGRSQNPSERVKGLLVGHERPAALICCFWMDEAAAVMVERKIHKKLRQTNVHARGEMYYLDAEAAVATIKTIIGKRAVEMAGIERLEPEVAEPKPPGYGYVKHRDLASSRWINGQSRHRGK